MPTTRLPSNEMASAASRTVLVLGATKPLMLLSPFSTAQVPVLAFLERTKITKVAVTATVLPSPDILMAEAQLRPPDRSDIGGVHVPAGAHDTAAKE